ncbi:MAG: DUF2314 domain-containing protein [Dysgonomonas sp.]|nr:DUF2314 domain-containing protein [Dysgonomonas sp.]
MAIKDIYTHGETPQMISAFEKAQETFKYFWRELSWEYRRIVPALDVAYVKVIFTQEVEGDDHPVVEHMWINDIGFDGEVITGTLINDPYQLTNVKNGDVVEVPLSQISDWLFAIRGKTYGGFTIHVLRSGMSDKERSEHDNAWGLDFGDYNDILLVYEQKEHPENLVEHPMSKNMKESLVNYIAQSPDILTAKDEKGLTFLHKEVIAGNLSIVETLLEHRANKEDMTNNGKTSLDIANQLGWEHLFSVLK